MFTLDEQTVIGTLRARGSKDFDVLYAQKDSMLAGSRALRSYGLVAMIVGGLIAGGLASLTLSLAVVGIPVALAGWWLRHKGNTNIQITEEAFNEYLESIGMKIEAPAA